MTYRLGVDVGGTFTDVLLYDSDDRHALAREDAEHAARPVGRRDRGHSPAAEPRERRPARPRRDPARHDRRDERRPRAPRRARRPASSREGFRHILHLAEAWTPGPLFGFMVYEKPEPLTDTRYVREVPERIGADGAIIGSLDEDAARAAIAELRDGRRRGYHGLACSTRIANGRHERRDRGVAASVAPTCRSRSPPRSCPSSASTSAP